MPYDKNDDLFNDCPICLAQMRADREGRRLTMGEFVAASRMAKRREASLETSVE